MGALAASWPILAVAGFLVLVDGALTRRAVAEWALKIAVRMYVSDPDRRRTSLEQWTADLRELRPAERSLYVASLWSVGVWRVLSRSPARRRQPAPSVGVVALGSHDSFTPSRTSIPIVGRLVVAAALAVALALSLAASTSVPDVKAIFGIQSSLAVVEPAPDQLLVVGKAERCSDRFCSEEVVAGGAVLQSGKWNPGFMQTFGSWRSCRTDVTSALVRGTEAIVVGCSTPGTPSTLFVLVFPPGVDQATIPLALSCPLAGWGLTADRLELDLAYLDADVRVRTTTTYTWFPQGLDTGLFVTSATGRPEFVEPPHCIGLRPSYFVPQVGQAAPTLTNSL